MVWVTCETYSENSQFLLLFSIFPFCLLDKVSLHIRANTLMITTPHYNFHITSSQMHCFFPRNYRFSCEVFYFVVSSETQYCIGLDLAFFSTHIVVTLVDYFSIWSAI